MNIRYAEQQDLPQLVEIYNQAIRAKCTAALEGVSIEDRQAWFDEHTEKKYPILVAESEGVVLGYLYMSAYRPNRSALKHTAEVSYFVNYMQHKKGVASVLMQACIELCPRLEIKTLIAILLETNASSISLLKKFSFEQWAHLPDVAEIDGVEVGQVYFGIQLKKKRGSL